MKRHRAYTGLARADTGASVALGNFDGVHLGHQSVIALARAAAGEIDAPLGVITFEPHPRQYFAPTAPAFRLMNAEARAHRLEKLGMAHLYELPFDAAMAGLSAEAFARAVLAHGLGIRHLVVGEDFRFGKGRAGDAGLLKVLGRDLGFGVTVGHVLQSPSCPALCDTPSGSRPQRAICQPPLSPRGAISAACLGLSTG